MRRICVLGSLALCVSTLGLVACTSTEGPVTPPPKDGGKTVAEGKTDPKLPPAEPLARAAIASVQMIEDCPNQNDGWRPPPVSSGQAPAAVAPAAAEAVGDMPPPAAGAPMPPAEGPAASAARVAAGAAIGDGGPGGWVQPCTQSTMQLAFTGQGDRTTKVVIEKVRLIDPKRDDSVATLVAREPAAWADGAYQSWNETIGPKQAVKASYELSVPDWNEVEEQIGGGSSYGVMFILEVDVKVDGELQRVRSPQFPREAPHVIAT